MTLNRFETTQVSQMVEMSVSNYEMTCTSLSKALCSTNYASKNLYANCPQRELRHPICARKVSGLWRNGPLARVAQSMVSANQRYLPWKRIGFDTFQPMVSANHSSNRPLDFSGASKNSVGLTLDLKMCLTLFLSFSLKWRFQRARIETSFANITVLISFRCTVLKPVLFQRNSQHLRHHQHHVFCIESLK